MEQRQAGSVTRRALVAMSAAGAMASARPAASESQRATLVVNAQVYTLNPAEPWAEAFAYDSRGVIVAIGTEQAVRRQIPDAVEEIDAGGNLVLPGFHDPHVHVPEAGINEELFLLPPDEDLATYVDLIAGYADQHPDDEWVRAAGASLFNLRDADELPIDALDRAVPDRPALILDDLGHAIWTNSRGLEAAGIRPDDPDPQGGILYRDPASGQLTGLLLENAQHRVRNVAAVDAKTVDRGLQVALKVLAENGITTVSDAGGFWKQHHPEAWDRAQANGKLTVRGVNALYLYPDLDMNDQIAEFRTRFRNNPVDMVQINTVKIYVDGILDLGTAAMLAPYDEPVDAALPSGFHYFKPTQLQTYVAELHAIGYRMHFHVIGDAATRAALDAIAAIPADRDAVASRRHRTSHTYLVNADDIPRFAALGVIADFQVGPESGSDDYQDYLSEFIGDRAFNLIPVGTLLESGAHVSLSSDWDADPLSPFGIIARAVSRTHNAVPDVATAIRLLTLDAAYALGQDGVTGSLEIGKFADFTIVDQNLLEIAVSRIEQTTVLLTMLAGRETYRSPSFPS